MPCRNRCRTCKSASRAFGHVDEVGQWQDLGSGPYDYVHLFTRSAAGEVDAATPVLRDAIRADGMIWMSWPKKASRVATDVTEDTIRDRALRDVLVDVKVCAVDETWSGLKLVVRKELRAKHKNS